MRKLEIMDNISFYFLIFGLYLIGNVQCEEYCINWDSGNEFCEDCCGDVPYEYCCESDAWLVGLIVGCVLGGLFILGVIVVVCCIISQQKARRGRVIQPGNVIQTPIYTTTVHVPYSQHGLTPQYGQRGHTLPPMYPPPPVNPPNNQNLYGDRANTLPEGLQSQPPASGGLPGNHRVV